MSTKNVPNADISMGSRLRAIREKIGCKLIDFSKKIGISHGSLSDIETSKTKPSADTLAKICRHTDINIGWLLTGEGPALWDKQAQGSTDQSRVSPVDMLDARQGDIVKTFKNKREAREINEILRRIEEIDERRFFRLVGRLEAELEQIEKGDETTLKKAGLTRRSST